MLVLNPTQFAPQLVALNTNTQKKKLTQWIIQFQILEKTTMFLLLPRVKLLLQKSLALSGTGRKSQMVHQEIISFQTLELMRTSRTFNLQ